MTAHCVLKCDGRRYEQACRGALTLPAVAELVRAPGGYYVDAAAARAGWRDVPGIGDVCPSLNHDHERDQ